MRLKQFEKAVGVFQLAAALKPDDPQERQLLASIQLMAHKPDDAITTLQPLLKSEIANTRVLELVATAYEDAHNTDQAVSTLRQAIQLDPQNVNLYLDFANISSQHQSFQVGINVVNDGINLLPNSAPLYFARGVLYVQLADYDRAQVDFAKAYELEPSQAVQAPPQ